ncbi:MAG: hypothetical protein ACKO03_06030 [Bacteroidota bacterium]
MRSFFLVLLQFCWITVHAQSIEWKPTKIVLGNFEMMVPDESGNVYALTKDGQLKKYAPSMDSMGVFNDIRRYGKLYSISADNPLRALLFFRDFKTILVLDRFLQVVNRIDVRKAGIFQAKAVGQSYDNKIWIFDEQASKLKKIDNEGKVAMETADLRLALNETIVPTVLFDLGGLVYVYDPEKGLFSFDYYGALNKRVAFLGWESVYPLGKNIIGYSHGKWTIYRPGTIETQEIAVPSGWTDFKQIRLMLGYGCALNADGLIKFDWKY